MFELTYESQALKELTSRDIKRILHEAIVFNEHHAITGCLIYFNQKFIQILEGDHKRIQNLFERIKLDKRHTDVRLVSEGAIVRRTFPKWGMAFYPVDENNTSATELEQFRRNLKLLADFSKPTTATTLLFWKKVKLLLTQSPDV